MLPPQDINTQPVPLPMIWLTGIILGFLIGVIVAADLFYRWTGAILSGIFVGIAGLALIGGVGPRAGVFCLGFAFVTMFTYRMGAQYYTSLRGGHEVDRIVILEKATWSRENIKPMAAVYGLLTGLLSSFALTLTFQAEFPPLARFVPAAVLISVVTLGLGVFSSGLAFGELELRQQPNQGIWRSFSNANLIFLVMVLSLTAYGPGVLLILSWAASLLGGISGIIYFFFGAWMIFGGFTVIQHMVLRYVLYRDGRIPLNLARFLDYAASLVFMRKIGGGYIFLHRYLLEYFAGLQQADSSALINSRADG
jgi:hypothetical protein